MGARSPQFRQPTSRMVPWTSTTRSGSLPAAWWRPSMFWVIERVELALALQLDQGEVAGVGLGASRPRSRAGCARPASAPRGRPRSSGWWPTSRPPGSSSTPRSGPGSRGCRCRWRCPAPVRTATAVGLLDQPAGVVDGRHVASLRTARPRQPLDQALAAEERGEGDQAERVRGTRSTSGPGSRGGRSTPRRPGRRPAAPEQGHRRPQLDDAG